MTIVISAQDPKVQNWLDTGGHEKGLIMIRWQGANQAPPPAIKAVKVNYYAINSQIPPKPLTLMQLNAKIRLPSGHLTLKIGDNE